MKRSAIAIRNDASGRCTIDIEGVIGCDDPAAGRTASYEGFRRTLRRVAAIEAGEVVVNIRSTGGDVNDALLIYEALSALGGRVVTRCYGYVASAATIIAQAASEGCRQIASSALYLIHNSMCDAQGNALDLEARTDLLRKTDERLAALYARRSKRTPEEMAALMAENGGDGRWLSPEEVVAAGLADAIFEHGEPEALPARERTPDRRGAPDEPAPATDASQGTPSAAACRVAEPAARAVVAVPAAQGCVAAHPGTGRWRTFVERLLGRTAPRAEAASPGTGPVARQAGERNILHGFDADAEFGRLRSAIAHDAGQRRVQPTATLPCEDPPATEPRTSENGRAYDEDARRFRRF